MMQCLLNVIVLVLLIMTVQPHPICNQATSGTTCYATVTANKTFLNEWLSLHHDSDGIDQLRGINKNSITKKLKDAIKMVIFIINFVYEYLLH